MNKSTQFRLIDEQRKLHCMELLSRVEANGKWQVEISPFKRDRSLSQNKLSFVWYRHISLQTGDTSQEVRRRCKLDYGVPIIAYSSDEFAATWSLIASNLDYEQQLEAMDFIEVTRLFNITEFTEYLNDIEKYYSPLGIPLPHPEDLYHEAMGVKAA